MTVDSAGKVKVVNGKATSKSAPAADETQVSKITHFFVFYLIDFIKGITGTSGSLVDGLMTVRKIPHLFRFGLFDRMLRTYDNTPGDV